MTGREWKKPVNTSKQDHHEDEVTLEREAETEDRALDKLKPRVMLSEAQVLKIVPVSRTTLYRMEKAGRFPKGTYISPNRRVWFEDEIVAWQNAVDEFNPNRGRGKGRRSRAAS
jgi:predicted DNA-binding transcriptional regulator AlpA